MKYLWRTSGFKELKYFMYPLGIFRTNTNMDQKIYEAETIKFCLYILLYQCTCAKLFQFVQLFVTRWTISCQASLSMRFSRQEY